MKQSEGEIIRVASMAHLAARSYVQITKVDADIDLELTDAVGRKVSRKITEAQWAYLLSLELLSREPIDDEAVNAFGRQLRQCHFSDQIETYLNGETHFTYSSLCQGPGAYRQQEFVAGINRVALMSFPECGSATEPIELVGDLAFCPFKILGCLPPQLRDGKANGIPECQIDAPDPSSSSHPIGLE